MRNSIFQLTRFPTNNSRIWLLNQMILSTLQHGIGIWKKNQNNPPPEQSVDIQMREWEKICFRVYFHLISFNHRGSSSLSSQRKKHTKAPNSTWTECCCLVQFCAIDSCRTHSANLNIMCALISSRESFFVASTKTPQYMCCECAPVFDNRDKLFAKG